MYRHLLVLIDGSPLSHSTVDQAITYARDVSARLTFFHAQPDIGATGDGALLRTLSLPAFAEAAAGNANALLAKAAAAARAAGVQYQVLAAVSDRPHEAIHAVAHDQGCDLIFLASHGRRGLKGMVAGSVTQRLLQLSTLPVLVAAVESNLPRSDAQRAIFTIKEEHRALAAVMAAMQEVIEPLRYGEAVPAFALLRAMLYYIENFPEKLHHPKEDEYLFRLLRERTTAFNAALDELQRQHVLGAAQLALWRDALGAFETGAPGARDRFIATTDNFVAAQWDHIQVEERVILPAAVQHLSEADWKVVASAFADHGDPRFGTDADRPYERLFARLLNLAKGTTESIRTTLAQHQGESL
ncbi:MAG: universal stress protein [Rhodoferax sp.]|uniref:universal stress protein n=1 Tax=Rhodoferax sp. TaxID=50421 RepID=UPI0027369070|nr:universal stress protein [Rhodoferax sp.]MDP2679094.1 universal stress protein [Rhodoferax sp.]